MKKELEKDPHCLRPAGRRQSTVAGGSSWESGSLPGVDSASLAGLPWAGYWTSLVLACPMCSVGTVKCFEDLVGRRLQVGA